MDGFKNTTRMTYMTDECKPLRKAKGGSCGPMKKATGGTVNEKGKRASLAEMEAEDRRMGSSMPAKKPMGKGIGAGAAAVAMGTKAAAMTRKGVPAYSDKPMLRK